ncbi:uncharacterized protein LOC121867125 [Homarus americanus]|nr:uncharacterized protein LOC121867125 [Homarus americanus]
MLWTLDKVVRVMFWGGVSALLATLLSALGVVSCLLAFITLWLLTAASYLYKADMKVSVSGKSVVVTGCDTGFGNTLALHLDKLGFRVFAGCLHAGGEGANHLRREGSSRLHVLQMDVTNQEQLDKAAQEVKHLLPEGEGLWGLVNNAGICTLGPIEWVSMKDFRRDPEVNVFGLIATTKTFLPLIRQGKGRVVSVASVAGRLSCAVMAPYCASKYAVEGFNDALRQEMRQFGVAVCLIEPGNFGAGTLLFTTNDAGDRRVLEGVSEDLKRDYGDAYFKRVEKFLKFFRMSGAKDISPVINAFTEALTQTHPQDRYNPMTLWSYFLMFVNTHLPAAFYDKLTKFYCRVVLVFQRVSEQSLWRMLWTLDKVVRVMFWGGVSALLATLLSALGVVSCLLAFITLWLLTAASYLYTADMKLPVSGKSVVVTGCDTGFGNTLALHLDKLGFRVFACCLHAGGEGANRLRREGSSRLHVLQMDVTNQEQLDKAAQEVKHLLPEGDVVWGLVNNAGLCTLGPVEWMSMESFRKDPEVNVFGLIATTKTFLPLIRQAKGRVVNVASVAGRMSAGFMGPYCVSKYAVEGFSDALRQEMRPFGVDVCILEPGNFANGTFLFATDEMVEREVEGVWSSLSEQVKIDYGQRYCKKVEGFKKNFRRKGAKDITPVINAITEALTQTHPQDRYLPMDLLMYFVAFVSTHLPAWIYDALVRLLAILLLKKDEV